jgi:hypothetical protein
MAATLSGFAFIGGPGLIYSVGNGALFIVLPAAITGALSAWMLGSRMRLLGEVRGLMTVPDAIGARYRSRAAQGLSAVAILVATVGYLATNLLALGLIVDAIFHGAAGGDRHRRGGRGRVLGGGRNPGGPSLSGRNHGAGLDARLCCGNGEWRRAGRDLAHHPGA